MQTKTYHEIQPGRKPFKIAVIKIAMWAIGRAWQTLFKFDTQLQEEIASWPDEYRVMFKVKPHGPQLVIQKSPDGQLRYAGAQGQEADADLVIYFKNVECGFLVFSAQIGIPQAYAEHRMSVKGDLRYGLSVIRSMNVIETYIFPRLIARQTVKRLVRIPSLKKYACRLWVYLLGIPFGL